MQEAKRSPAADTTDIYSQAKCWISPPRHQKSVSHMTRLYHSSVVYTTLFVLTFVNVLYDIELRWATQALTGLELHRPPKDNCVLKG